MKGEGRDFGPTHEFTLGKDYSVPLMHHDLIDL